MFDKVKSTIQEQLSTIYLRLNGYFTTGQLIQSSQTRILTDLDMLSVRLPFHKQEDTEHNSSPFLEVPNNIDIIIAEVKSRGVSLQFNECLKDLNDIEAWQKLLFWTGVFEANQIDVVANELVNLVQPVENSKLINLKSTSPIQTHLGIVTVRPILFSPERDNDNNTDKFINWKEINDFLWLCLCPATPRARCGTRYDFTAWGYGLREIVKAYKDRQKTQIKFTGISELYADVQNLRK